MIHVAELRINNDTCLPDTAYRIRGMSANMLTSPAVTYLGWYLLSLLWHGACTCCLEFGLE